MFAKIDKTGAPIDRGWAWMIVVGFFGCSFFMVGIAKSFGILMDAMKEYFQVDLVQASIVLAVSGGVYTLAAPFGLAFGEIFTQRKVVIFGGIIGGIGVSLSSLLFSIEYMVVMFGLFSGVSNACLFGNGLVMIGHYFEQRRSLANALALTGASIGQFVMPRVLQILMDNYGLSGTILVIGSLYFELIVCGLLYRPLTFYTVPYKRKMEKQKSLLPKEKEALMDQTDTDNVNDGIKATCNKDGKVDNSAQGDQEGLLSTKEDGNGDVKKTNNSSLGFSTSSTHSVIMGSVDNMTTLAIDNNADSKTSTGITIPCCGKRFVFPKLFYPDVLKNPIVIMFVIISFIIFFGYFNFIIFLPSDVKSRGIDDSKMSWLVSISGIGDLIGRIAVGIVGDLNLVKRYKIMSFVVIVCGIDIFLFNFASAYWFMGLLSCMYGLFGGAYVAINAVVLIDLVGIETMPKALGMVILIQGAGAALGQPVLGALQKHAKSFTPLIILEACLMVFGGLILLFHPLFIKGLCRPHANKEVEQGEDQLQMPATDSANTMESQS